MYDARTLKPHILVDSAQVECPVKGCSRKVARQHEHFQTAPQFQCPEHRIYISPKTFEYPTELENLLWKDERDVSLLDGIKGSKRESRMARDNSEDALSWNVFRYLEKSGNLSAILSCITGGDLGPLQLVYWSYSPVDHGPWGKLTEAREEFGEQLQRSSEPDLIAFNEKAVLFIEAKLTANNETTPSDPENPKKYVTGGNGWYHQVIASDYDVIAKAEKKYELMRFWLLGSWIAAQDEREFYLVNLVRSEFEQDIVKLFGGHIKANTHRHFMRATWEEIRDRIAERIPSSAERDSLLNYYENKTIGYDPSGDLRLAFSKSKVSVARVGGY
jgi:hypothetical protein